MQGSLRSGSQLLLMQAKSFIPEEENSYGFKLISSTFIITISSSSSSIDAKLLALDHLAINDFYFLYLKSSFSSYPYPPFLSVLL